MFHGNYPRKGAYSAMKRCLFGEKRTVFNPFLERKDGIVTGYRKTHIGGKKRGFGDESVRSQRWTLYKNPVKTRVKRVCPF